MMTLAIGGFIAVLLLFFGWLVKYKKAYWLIAGYNTMSADKKKNVDTEGLGKYMGNLMFVLAVITFAGFLFSELGIIVLAGASLVLFLPVIIIGLIRAQRFDGNTRDAHGNMNTKSKGIMIVVISLLLLVSVGVGVMVFYGSRPAEYSIENGVLNISGMYGQEVPISEISDIQLLDEMPEITFKTNGSGLGNMMKGNFTVKGIGGVKLFVDVSKSPFIYLETSETTYILNGADEKTTRALYADLVAELNGISN